MRMSRLFIQPSSSDLCYSLNSSLRCVFSATRPSLAVCAVSCVALWGSHSNLCTAESVWLSGSERPAPNKQRLHFPIKQLIRAERWKTNGWNITQAEWNQRKWESVGGVGVFYNFSELSSWTLTASSCEQWVFRGRAAADEQDTHTPCQDWLITLKFNEV